MVEFACRRLGAGLLGLLASLSVVSGLGIADAAASEPAFEMPVGGSTNAPVGYIDFCKHFGDQCSAHGADQVVGLDASRWRDLQEVNALVNRIVSPATDQEIYKRDEVWTLPEAYGDCEDYVLLKRKLLVERGWSTGMLLVTVVFDEIGDGHAVLLARTDRGDFVLDNKTDMLKRWYDTAYRFVKRQSTSDPNRWVSIGDPRWSAKSTAAAPQ